MRTLTLSIRLGGSRRRRTESPNRTRRGFSIVEAIVAIVMLAFGVLAMASSSAMTIREMRAASQRVNDAALAASNFERLRSLDTCTSMASKASALGATAVRANSNPDMMRVTVTLPATAGVRRTTQTYTSNIPCA